MVRLLTMYCAMYVRAYHVDFEIFDCFMCIYDSYDCISDPVCEYKVPCDNTVIIW